MHIAAFKDVQCIHVYIAVHSKDKASVTIGLVVGKFELEGFHSLFPINTKSRN
jgi:hypothetical protein